MGGESAWGMGLEEPMVMLIAVKEIWRVRVGEEQPSRKDQ